MSNHGPNPWKVTIIGGSIAGLIPLLIVALFSEARAWLFYKAEYTNLTVFLLLLVPLISGVIAGGWLSRKATATGTAEGAAVTPPLPVVSPLPELDDMDRYIVRALVSIDDWASIPEIGVKVGRQKLVVECSLSKLMEHGYVKDLLAVGQESLYKLTPAGTSYAIENNLNRVFR